MIRRLGILFGATLFTMIVGGLTFAIFGSNGLVFLIWLVISILPVMLIKARRWLVFAKLATVFLLSQFVILPIVYSVLLNKNPNSFEVDTFIQSEESRSAYIDVIEKYKPEKSQYAMRLIKSVLNSEDERLNNYFYDETRQTLEFSSGDLLIQLQTSVNENIIDVSTLEGDLLGTFSYNHLSLIDFDKISVSNLLKAILQNTAQSQASYSIEIDKLKKKQIWNYSRMLPYSVNMVGVSNLVPKTRFANMIYTIQYYLMNGILLSLIISAVYQFIIDRGSIDSNRGV